MTVLTIATWLCLAVAYAFLFDAVLYNFSRGIIISAVATLAACILFTVLVAR